MIKKLSAGMRLSTLTAEFVNMKLAENEKDILDGLIIKHGYLKKETKTKISIKEAT